MKSLTLLKVLSSSFHHSLVQLYEMVIVVVVIMVPVWAIRDEVKALCASCSPPSKPNQRSHRALWGLKSGVPGNRQQPRGKILQHGGAVSGCLSTEFRHTTSFANILEENNP